MKVQVLVKATAKVVVKVKVSVDIISVQLIA